MLVTGQCNRTVKETVNSSSLSKWTERVMWARCCLSFRRVNCYFLWKRITDMQFLSQKKKKQRKIMWFEISLDSCVGTFFSKTLWDWVSLKRFPLVCHDINVKLTIAPPPPPPLLPNEDPQCFNYPPPFSLIGSQFSVVPFELCWRRLTPHNDPTLRHPWGIK